MLLGTTLAIIVSTLSLVVESIFAEQMRALKFLAIVAGFQLIFAVTGLISGIHFLKLRSWARTSLEILSWLTCVSLIVFLFFWEYQWLKMNLSNPSQFGNIVGAILGVIVLGFYLTPFVIMIRYLRGQKVQQAIAVTFNSTERVGTE